MAKRVYTLDVEDKNLKSSSKSVVSNKKLTKTEKEVENFGIVEINNASSTKIVKNKKEKGFEKNVFAGPKRTVKTKINEVDDYFDFSFRKNNDSKTEDKKVEVKAKAETKTEEVVKTHKIETSQVETTDTIEVKQAATSATIFDSDAYRIVMVARMGSLFDCDKRMINA